MNEFTYHDFLAYYGIGGAHPGGLLLTKEIISLEKINANTKILDVGCGTGQTSAYIAKKYGCEVTALDCHPLMIEKANQRFIKENVKVHLVEGDLMNLPFSDNSYDLIIAESITIFTLIPRALDEYVRVLRLNGILIDLEMTAEKSFLEQDMGDFQTFYGIEQIPTEEEWCELIEKAGLSSVKVLKEGTVASTFNKGHSMQDVILDFNPSARIDPGLHDIWNKHQKFTNHFSCQLGYRVYRSKN